jgi:3-dehydrosphinganine reductase
MKSLIDHILNLLNISSTSSAENEYHLVYSLLIGSILSLLVIFLLQTTSQLLNPTTRTRTKSFKDKHVLVTGGSKGTGKALAILLAKKGAHVTIIARNLEDLNDALKEIKENVLYSEQIISAIQCDVTDSDKAAIAVQKAFDSKPLDYVFCFAGASVPGFFQEQDLSLFRKGMDLNYFGALNVVHPAVKLMIQSEDPTGDCGGGSIGFCASVLGMFSLVGYSQYAPTKFALRGLAETLRQELKPYNISTHIMFPGTILSPGFLEEQKTKPEVTKLIEGADEGQKPEVIAEAFLKGIEHGQFMITSDIIGELARCCSKGVSPSNNYVTDAILCALGWIVFPFWRMYADYLTVSHAKSKSKQKLN